MPRCIDRNNDYYMPKTRLVQSITQDEDTLNDYQTTVITDNTKRPST
jgi:hypothetical protein